MQLLKISHLDQHYPELLREMRNPPVDLWYRGTLAFQGRPTVAIVGTRRPSPYGKYVTELYARTLAQAGVVIVSGLAFGIDKIAHETALEAGGTTIAVLGSGADTISPRAHERLAQDILEHGGAIISEQPPGTPALASHIVARNRIIAGLCQITLVTQAGENSGTLHTAQAALKDNRMVYAVPNRIDDQSSAGSNDLIRTNVAHLTTSPLELLTDLSQELKMAHTRSIEKMPSLGQREAAVLKLFHRRITTLQGLLDASQLNAGELAETMSLLEMSGRISNLGAGQWALKHQSRVKPRSI